MLPGLRATATLRSTPGHCGLTETPTPTCFLARGWSAVGSWPLKGSAAPGGQACQSRAPSGHFSGVCPVWTGGIVETAASRGPHCGVKQLSPKLEAWASESEEHTDKWMDRQAAGGQRKQGGGGSWRVAGGSWKSSLPVFPTKGLCPPRKAAGQHQRTRLFRKQGCFPSLLLAQ